MPSAREKVSSLGPPVQGRRRPRRDRRRGREGFVRVMVIGISDGGRITTAFITDRETKKPGQKVGAKEILQGRRRRETYLSQQRGL